jgi:hypothetical protein
MKRTRLRILMVLEFVAIVLGLMGGWITVRWLLSEAGKYKYDHICGPGAVVVAILLGCFASGSQARLWRGPNPPKDFK